MKILGDLFTVVLVPLVCLLVAAFIAAAVIANGEHLVNLLG